MKEQQQNKILLAMSGGFDSTLAIYLLQQKGYEVIGVFLQTSKNLDEDLWVRIQKIAEFFKIKIYKLDIHKDFRQKVIQPFLDKYQQGITPSPCVNCNPQIKFKSLVDMADELGIEKIATGHYVRKKKYKGDYYLYRGVDYNKDQTYFLYKLSAGLIPRLVFPLGNKIKSEIKNKLKKILPSDLLPKGESQELCFIPDNDFKEFFNKHQVDSKSGDIVNLVNNEVLGKHKGIMFYTIGQRKNLGLAGGPWYVYKLDAKENIVYVVHSDNKDQYLFTEQMVLKNIYWQIKEPELPDVFLCKIRSAQKLSEVKVSKKQNKYYLDFLKPQLAVTSGQSIVFYKGDRLLGGSEL